LDDRFQLLTGGPRGVLPRQQTLRASVDWSYDLLSEQERLLLARLAVFAGGWSLDAVQAVCGGDGLPDDAILDLLTSLVDKSLVVAEDRGRVARYRMLETVRRYAIERLDDTDELAPLRDRHLDFFVAAAERGMVELDLPQNLDWLDVLEPETANFDAAIERGLEVDPERVLRIGVALTSWWEMAGRFTAGQHVLVRGLDAAEPAPGRPRGNDAPTAGAPLVHKPNSVDQSRDQPQQTR
jgi:predicted ATPase